MSLTIPSEMQRGRIFRSDRFAEGRSPWASPAAASDGSQTLGVTVSLRSEGGVNSTIPAVFRSQFLPVRDGDRARKAHLSKVSDFDIGQRQKTSKSLPRSIGMMFLIISTDASSDGLVLMVDRPKAQLSCQDRSGDTVDAKTASL
jgi:hypothetical protein